jgi:hypothetical protein
MKERRDGPQVVPWQYPRLKTMPWAGQRIDMGSLHHLIAVGSERGCLKIIGYQKKHIFDFRFGGVAK